MIAAEKTLLCAGRHLNFVRRGHWEYVERRQAGGAVVIIAFDDKDQLILTEQFRPPLSKSVIDLPAGIFGDLPGAHDESPERAAQRELQEETGYEAGKLKFLLASPAAAGTSDEVIHFYQATQLQRTGAGGGDAHENIKVHAVPRAHLREWLNEQNRQGKLIDHKIFAGLYLTVSS